MEGVCMKKNAIICCALLASLILTISGCGEGDEEAAVGDTTPPTVKGVVVAGDTSAAATNGPIMIVFSEAVDPASVQAAVTFTPQVDGSVSYNEETSTLTFDPKSDLQDHTKYSITVSNVADKAGKVMEPFTFEIFAGEPDVTPPTIKETTPKDGELEASVEPRFTIGFSERIDVTELGQDLSLTPDTGVPVERWLFTPSEDGKQVEIFIALEKGLEILVDFTLHIGASSVVDLVGNGMERDVEIKFTTEAPPHEDIDPKSQTALTQAWLYIIWKDQSNVWHIIWGGSKEPEALVLVGDGTISSHDGVIDDVKTVAWEAGDLQALIDGVLTFNAAVNGTGGTDGLTFKVIGKTVLFELKNAEPEWIHIGNGRKHPEAATFTLLSKDN
jgi:hypothetical protein